MSAIRNKAPRNDLEHERDFWAWKYERREAECEELATRLGKLQEGLKREIKNLRSNYEWEHLDEVTGWLADLLEEDR